MYAFVPEKTPSLVGRNFYLAMASQKVRPTALRLMNYGEIPNPAPQGGVFLYPGPEEA
jgi:hypothetical protein